MKTLGLRKIPSASRARTISHYHWSSRGRKGNDKRQSRQLLSMNQALGIRLLKHRPYLPCKIPHWYVLQFPNTLYYIDKRSGLPHHFLHNALGKL